MPFKKKRSASQSEDMALVIDPITTDQSENAAESTASATRAEPAPAVVDETTATPPKKRGRPPKHPVGEEPPKKRGRPPKHIVDEGHLNQSGNKAAASAEPNLIPKKRGRPPKSTVGGEPSKSTVGGEASKSTVDGEPPRKRGRPPKTATVGEEPPKKRGRPPKVAAAEGPPKKRGRPPKSTAQDESSQEPIHNSSSATEPDPELAQVTPKKRGRGRPPKNATVVTAAVALLPSETAPTTVKKRGRPKKVVTPVDALAVEDEQSDAPAVPETEYAPPKRRGRPPKGGATTKIAANSSTAADQLEIELEKEATTSGHKNASLIKGEGKAPMTNTVKEETNHLAEDDLNDEAPAKNYWMMKAEQEDREVITDGGKTINVKFTIDHLRSKSEPEPWDGVRNPTAAKNMRAMKKGDLAFFYASGGKSGRKPGIVGIMEIVQGHEPDLSAWDKDSYGYVKDIRQRDKWCVVHVEFRKKLTKPVFLSELQKHGKSGGALEHMQQLSAARLSVSKVTEKEWNFINDNLIPGFENEETEEDEDEGDGEESGGTADENEDVEIKAVDIQEEEDDGEEDGEKDEDDEDDEDDGKSEEDEGRESESGEDHDRSSAGPHLSREPNGLESSAEVCP